LKWPLLPTFPKHCDLSLVSGYPDVQSAMAAIALEADEVIVKPFKVEMLAELIRQKMLARKPAIQLEKERVSAILQRCIPTVVEEWLARVRDSSLINHLPLSSPGCK
jgi:hypothetical protein